MTSLTNSDQSPSSFQSFADLINSRCCANYPNIGDTGSLIVTYGKRRRSFRFDRDGLAKNSDLSRQTIRAANGGTILRRRN
jgi:hypothetical protein